MSRPCSDAVSACCGGDAGGHTAVTVRTEREAGAFAVKEAGQTRWRKQDVFEGEREAARWRTRALPSEGSRARPAPPLGPVASPINPRNPQQQWMGEPQGRSPGRGGGRGHTGGGPRSGWSSAFRRGLVLHRLALGWAKCLRLAAPTLGVGEPSEILVNSEEGSASEIVVFTDRKRSKFVKHAAN